MGFWSFQKPQVILPWTLKSCDFDIQLLMVFCFSVLYSLSPPLKRRGFDERSHFFFDLIFSQPECILYGLKRCPVLPSHLDEPMYRFLCIFD